MKLIKLNFTIILFIALLMPVSGQEIIQGINFIGNNKFNENTYKKWSGIQTGTFWSSQNIIAANKRIIDHLHGEGYLYALIDSVGVSLDKNNMSRHLTWYVSEDLPFYLGDVNISADSLNNEELDSQVDFGSGEVYREDIIEEEFAIINQFYAKNGYPLATVFIEKTLVNKSDDHYVVDLDIRVNSGIKVIINDINIKGNKVTKRRVIIRELDLSVGDVYNQEKIDDIPERLNRLGFFKNVEPAKLILTKDKKRNVLKINVEEGNTTTFDGIIGYIPPKEEQSGEEGYFTGMMQLSFQNLFGTARKFEVDWKKPDKYSDEFRLYYEEPWIFNYPINLGVGLERIVRDTTYIEKSYFFNGALRITGNFKSTFELMQKTIIPDSTASRMLGLARNTLLSGEVGIEYDTRDYPPNPRKGIVYKTSYSFGFKKNTGPSYLIQSDGISKKEEIQTVKIRVSYFLSLWKNQILYFNLFGARIRGSANQLQLTDHFWFGGARSLRGYRENQFHGTTVSWFNFEYRFLAGRNSRIFAFNDWGFYNYKNQTGNIEKILPGFGVGIRFDTPLGIMGVDYGLGKGDSFSSGKIHFGIVNRF